MFHQSGNKKTTACLNNYMGFSQLADYYRGSANVLIEEAVNDSTKLDVYIYSAVFLYRHSVELQLKELVWMSNSLLGKGKIYPPIHCLIELWNIVKSNAKTLLASDFPLNKLETQYIEYTFHEIKNHDPGSYSFRYTVDKRMKRNHPNLTHINVKELHKRFNQIYKYLGQLSHMIECLYNMK